MSDEQMAARLYPDLPAVKVDDLSGLHAVYETPVADRPADVASLNSQFSALGISGLDAKGLVNSMTTAAAGPQTDRARLMAHVQADKALTQLDQNWPQERDQVAAWLRAKAPGVHKLLIDSGAANNSDLLLELRGAFRRRRQ